MRRTIYSNSESQYDLDDYNEMMRDFGEAEISQPDSNYYDWVNDNLQCNYDSSMDLFDKELKGGKCLILIGKFGRWNGEFNAINKTPYINLNGIIQQANQSGDECEVFVENKQVYARFNDHDGSSLMRFAIVKETDLDYLTNKFVFDKNAELADKSISRRLKSPYSLIKEACGW